MRIPLLSRIYNLYPATNSIVASDVAKAILENCTHNISLKSLDINPNKEQLEFWSNCNRVNGNRDPVIKIAKNKTQILILEEVTLFGHTGLLVDEKKRCVIGERRLTGWGISGRNLMKARRLKSINTKQVDDSLAISMVAMHNGHKHLYHFFIDYFEPLYFYLTNYYKNEKIIILLRNDLSKIQKDCYDFLQKQYPKIEYLTIYNHQKIHLHRLLWIRHYTQNRERPIFDKKYGEFLQNLFFTGYGIDRDNLKATRLIYISRKDAKLRHILSEDEIIARLKPLGFEIIEASKLNYKEQIELFATSRIIVTAHGAALTNLSFCQPKTKILEITACDYLESTYLIQGLAMGLEMHNLIGSKQDFKQNFNIDPDIVIDKVRSLI